MKQDISVSLIIYGYEPDVREITRLLGISPDRALNKGQPLMEGAGPIPQSLWELKSKLPRHEDAEEHIAQLLELLRPHREQLAQITSKHRSVIAVEGRYQTTNPDLELEPGILKDLGDLGLGLWLDVYTET